MEKNKALALTAIMGALANTLAFPPLAVPITVGGFESSIHFSQIPIFLGGALAGPFYGLMAGAIGGLFMGSVKPGIPFILAGLAILGWANGIFCKKLRPFLAGLSAWCAQAPYVLLTDYIWFTLFLEKTSVATWAIVTSIMIKLTVEAVISAALVDILVHYIRRTGIL